MSYTINKPLIPWESGENIQDNFHIREGDNNLISGTEFVSKEIAVELLTCLKKMLEEFEKDNSTEYEIDCFWESKQAIAKAEK